VSIQLTFDVKNVQDSTDTHHTSHVKYYFLRILGFSFFEIITADPKHEMFAEDPTLKSLREHMKQAVIKRVNLLLVKIFPEISKYQDELIINKSIIFGNWVSSNDYYRRRGCAPLGAPAGMSWADWINTPGLSKPPLLFLFLLLFFLLLLLPILPPCPAAASLSAATMRCCSPPPQVTCAVPLHRGRSERAKA
jgi:hypothetical protein